MDFTGKIVLVTGGSRGLGAACCLLYAKAKAQAVIIHYNRNKAEAESLAITIEKEGCQAKLVQADVSVSAEVDRMFEEIFLLYGKVDIMVANAGIYAEENIGLDEMSDEEWENLMRINLNGVFYCCRAASRIFKRQKTGNIVTISSTAGIRGAPFHSHYAASKSAILGLTKSLAVELAPIGKENQQNVRVNCVAPGWIETDMVRSTLAEESFRSQIEREIPLGRIASAQDVANAVLFLSSELARHITGEVLNVNGGAVLHG